MNILSVLKSKAKKLCYRLIRSSRRFKLCRILTRNLLRKRISCYIATAEDASDLCQIYLINKSAEQEHPVEEQIKRLENLKGLGYTLIARVGKEIAGALVIRKYPENSELYPDWWILNLFVLARYRALGVGQELTRMAIQEAAAQDSAKVYLLVFEQNKVAVNLYRKIGFQRCSIPKLDAQLEEEAQKTGKRRIIMNIQPVSNNDR